MSTRVIVCAAVAALGLGGAIISTGAGAAGQPVPAHTSATSISFISAQQAFVLGTAPCAQKPCTVVLHTTDRGTTWEALAAPREAVSYPDGDGLWGIRFADPLHGFAYGRGMWATSDGGQSWTAIAPPARFVLGLAVVGGSRLVAVASSCGDSLKCGPADGLFERSLAGGEWVLIASAKLPEGAISISVHSLTVWAMVGTKLLVSTDGGATFRAHGQPCGRQLPSPAQVADDGPHTYLLCIGSGFTGHTVKYVYRTSGTRSGWKLVGRPPTPGDGGELAAGSDRAVVLASSSAASWLYRSTDAGRRWHVARFENDGGQGWGDLAFTTASDGVVIHGPAQTDGASSNFPGQVLLTEDGSHSWRAVTF